MDESAQILDDLLCRWCNWSRPVSVGRGWQHTSVGLGQYRTSRQYDDTNGALDADIEHVRLKAVDHQIQEMADPWRTAIHAEGRRLVVGVDVFSSPRLPVDPDSRRQVIAHARSLLVGRLQRAGVM